MDLHKFLSFLLKQSLFLTRINKFEDKREGINLEQLLFLNYKKKADKSRFFNALEISATIDNFGKEMNQIEDSLKIIQRFNFANCWVLSENKSESVAMWNLYSNPNSIAIKTKYSDFKKKFSLAKIQNYGEYEEIICSPIEYIDFHNNDTIVNLIKDKKIDPVFVKDLSFQHEKEFRIVMKEKVRKIPQIEYKKNFTRKLFEDAHNKRYNYSGISIKLEDFNSYNFEVVHHPKSEDWAKENINQIIDKFKMGFKISESELNLK
jgi:hypothetical protein